MTFMRQCCSLALVLILILVETAPAIAQTTPAERPAPITLYSPLKYRVKHAPPMSNGRQPGDHSRAHLDLTTGTLDWAFGRINLTYGFAYLGEDLDWFLIGGADDDRSVIKDLGVFTWYDRFKVPVIKPLPALKPGEKRQVTLDTSGRRNGEIGADGANGGSAGIYESVMGAEPGGNGRSAEPGSISTGSAASPAAAAPKKPALPKQVISIPIMVKAVLGHMYVVHVVTDESDFYVLIHVDGLVRGDNCTVSWMRLSGSASPSPPIIGGSAKVASSNGSSSASATIGLTTSTETSISQSKTPVLARAATDEGPATTVAIEKPPVLIPANPGAAAVAYGTRKAQAQEFWFQPQWAEMGSGQKGRG
jgi:hypothetical protein